MNPDNPNLRSAELSAAPAAIAAEALRWAARRQQGLAPTELRDLQIWLAADARHARAFRAADTDRDELDWPLHAGTADAVMLGLARRARRRRSQRLALACAAAVLLGCGAVWRLQTTSPQVARSGLAVIEPQRRVLPDGSMVELMADAEITVEFEERYRLVTLQRGVAHFEVASNPRRPFVVRVGEVAVRAVGTAFVVGRGAGEVSVVVTHGQVALDAAASFLPSAGAAALDSPLALVSAGSLARVDNAPLSGGAPTAPVVRLASEGDLETAIGWRAPRLEFSGTPLAEVIAAMNRHNRLQFVIADEALAQLRLSGTLRADKVVALVEILETDFPIRAERRGDEIALHRR